VLLSAGFSQFLAIPGLIVGLVLALVNIFKKQPSRGLILAYAGFQGLFVGGISNIFNTMWDGIVTQAVFGTLAVVGVTLFLFLNGRSTHLSKSHQDFLGCHGRLPRLLAGELWPVMFGATESMFGLRSYEIFGIPTRRIARCVHRVACRLLTGDGL
jgi:uncharacterized YccA/Bax inhibitor family protein